MNQLPMQMPTSPFDAIRQVTEDGQEFWSARELQKLLGYTKWERFEDAIERAKISCKITGQNPDEQFPDAGKPIISGKGRTQEARDYHLSRFACYLVAMNGDPRKEEIAAAQTYFTVKTREAETAQLQVLPASSLMKEWEGRLREVETLEEEDHFTDPSGEIPPALIKALTDQPWTYRLGLRNGQVIHFSGARLVPGGKWVTLVGDGGNHVEMSDVSFARGLNVRVSDIAWIADAPNGS